MQVRRPHSHQAGFTLIETAITFFLLAIVLGVAGMVSSSSQGAFEATNLQNGVEESSRRALNRVVDELSGLSATLMFPALTGPFGDEQVNFQQVRGVNNGAPVLGPLTRIRFEYDPGEADDGQDNDGDGLVDEGEVVMTRDVGGAQETVIVVCRDVREMLAGETAAVGDENGNGVEDEKGFSLQRIGDVVTVRLTLESLGREGDLVTRTVETSFKLRN